VHGVHVAREAAAVVAVAIQEDGDFPGGHAGAAEDLLEAAAGSCEHPPHQVVMRPAAVVGQQGVLAPVQHEQPGVDGGAGTEMCGWYSPVLFEVEPGPPLGCHHRGTTDAGAATRDLPLHQEDRVSPPR